MSPLDPERLPPETIRPLKRVEYDHLVELGAFQDERVELLYGWLVAMSPQGAAHSFVVRELLNLLAVALAGRAKVQVQAPLAASDESEPEPDLAVLPPASYVDDHPTTAHLVVEVADSSRTKDLTVKARLYAEMAVPEYWVADLARGMLVVHREPAIDRYAEVRTYSRDGEVALLRFPDVVVRIADILPPR